MAKTARPSEGALPGKAQLDDLLAQEMNAEGSTRPVSLAVLDLDQFMSVNDNYGHDAGDRVIAQLTDLLRTRLADHATGVYRAGVGPVFRMGGDEFSVVLPGTEKEQAFLALEAIRSEFASLESIADIEPHPTLSVGVATFPDDGSTRAEVMRKADDALYRGKSLGRNRVTLAREEKKVPKTIHFTQGQLDRLAALSGREGVGEAELLREALDDLLKKYTS